MKKTIFSIILVLSCLLLLTCSSKENQVNKPDISVVDSNNFYLDTVKVITMKHLTGTNLYNLHCKMCHGNYGKGDGVKARFSDGKICPHDLSKVTRPDKEVYYIVLNGEKTMPNQHELDSSDVWVIVVYIKKFKDLK